MKLRQQLTAAFRNADFVSAASLLLLSFPLLAYPLAHWAVGPLACLWIVLFLLRARTGAVLNKLSNLPGARFVSPALVCVLVFCYLVMVFLIKLPPHQWGSVIFFDDYAPGYAASLKGIEALRQGGLFGWDSRVLGGYYMVSEVPMNRALFLLPFAALFGPQAGYHAMILVFYCAFPLLSFAYARSVLLGRNAAYGAFIFAAIFLIGFLRSILNQGMIDVLMGLDFFILNLILFERTKSGRRMAAFFLSVSIAATMYAHITFFLCSIAVFVIELVRTRSKPLVKRTFAVLVFSFFMTLWYSFYFVYYHRYFIGNPEVFDPSTITLASQIVSTVWSFVWEINPFHSYVWTSNPEALALGLACVIAYTALRTGGTLKTIVIYTAVFIFLCCLQFQASAIVTSRACYCVQFFLTIILGQFAARQVEERRVHNLVIVLCIMTPVFSPLTYPAVHHIKSIREQWPAFFSTVSNLGGNMVLLENISHWVLVPDDPVKFQPMPVEAHWESLVSFETDKKLFCTTMEGHHYSIYRGNALNSGTFRGKQIDRYRPEEIAAVLSKWGIRYCVLWSEESRRFFSSASSLFRFVRNVDGWSLFEFLQSDPRSAVITRGSAECQDKDYFAKRLILKDAIAGDTAIIRQNYFPSWKAWYAGKKLRVINCEGQMAVVAPANGSYAIDLTFPKYPLFSWAALLSAIASLAWFGYGAHRKPFVSEKA